MKTKYTLVDLFWWSVGAVLVLAWAMFIAEAVTGGLR